LIDGEIRSKVFISAIGIVGEALLALGYWPGWLLVRCFTLGRRPKPNPKPSARQRALIGWLGMTVLVGVGVLCLWLAVHQGTSGRR
jgi:hypothetical protein